MTGKPMSNKRKTVVQGPFNLGFASLLSPLSDGMTNVEA